MFKLFSRIWVILALFPLVAAALFAIMLFQTEKMNEANKSDLARISGLDLEVLERSYQLINILADIERRLVESIGNSDKEELTNVTEQKKRFLGDLDEIVSIESKFTESVAAVRREFNGFIDQSFKITDILVDNKMEEFGFENFQALMSNRNASKDALAEALAGLKADAQNSINTRIQSSLTMADQNYEESRNLAGIAIAAMVSLYALMLFLVRRPITRLVNFADQVGAGDLSSRVDDRSHSEIGDLARAFNQMVANLHSITSNIRESNEQIIKSAKDILSAAVQQTNGTNEQAAAINETSATVNELKETSGQSEQRAQEVVETAARSVDFSKRGRNSVQETVKGMVAIQDQVQNISNGIMSLSERTEAIGDIIATVNEIAEQSNVLAVNASIEAAKAGEYGRGFEVVAREVKTLADQSKDATNQVRMLLTEVKKATSMAVMATEDGKQKAGDGSQLVQVAGENIDHLSDIIDESARAAKQIAITSHQQSVGIDQIAIAIENIRQTTNDSISSVRQTEQAAKSLNELAQATAEVVAKYQLE